MTDGSAPLPRLWRAARSARRRLALNAALRRLGRALPLPGGLAVSFALARAIWAVDSSVQQLAAVGVAAALLAALGWSVAALLARPGADEGALALDRHYETADRFTNALAFSRLPESRRNEWMRAAIADALARRPEPTARAAVPLRAPRGLWVGGLLALLAVVAFGFLPARLPSSPAAAAPAAPAASPLLSSDDIELLEEGVRELAAEVDDATVAGAVDRLNRLLEDLAERRIDRDALFSELAELEKQLGSASGAAEDAALAKVGRALSKSRLARRVARALEQRDYRAAQRAMRKLAERVRKDPAVTDEQRKALQQALADAAKQSQGRTARLRAARAEAQASRRRLLKKKSQGEKLSPSEQRELARQERQLQRLGRSIPQAERAQEQLSDLDRELAQAARELMKELGDGARHLEAGAEEINSAARRQMTRQQKEQLKKQLQEMRELLRRGGPDRKKHLQRLEEFAKRARGGSGRGGSSTEAGQKGGRRAGAGQRGEGQESSGARVALGPGGRPRPGEQGEGRMGLSRGAARAGGDRAGGQMSQGPAAGKEAGGKVAGSSTELAGKTQDVSAAAVDTGEGAASSEVVYGAAQRGFIGSNYQKVYAQYETVAEDVLAKQPVPAGYEQQVRRYFQLIRPRPSE